MTTRIRSLVTLSDVVLVFAVIDAELGVGVLQVDARPWLAALFAAVVIGLSVPALGRRQPVRGVATILLGVTVGAGLFCLVVSGHPYNAPYHDSVLIEDAAANRLLSGQDPYTQDYLYSATRTFYTPDMPVNFGVNHFVYPPGLILLATPLRWVSRLGGPQLGVIYLYPVALVGLVAAAAAFGRDWLERGAMVTALALNPVFVIDADTGFFNDVFFLAPLVGAAAALNWRRPYLAGALMGLALTTKQQALVAIPFLALAAVQLTGVRGLKRALVSGTLVVAALNLPFLVWNAHAFLASVIGTFYASGVDNYPIRGIGLDGLLLGAGVIPSRWGSFPSLPLQLAVTVPFLGLALYRLHRRWSWPLMWAALAGTTFSLFFFGRGLVVNYLDLVLIYLACAVLTLLPSTTREDRLPARAGEGPDAGAAGGAGVHGGAGLG